MSGDNNYSGSNGRGGGGTKIVKPVPGGELPSTFSGTSDSGSWAPAADFGEGGGWQPPPNSWSPKHCTGLNPLETTASTLLNILGDLHHTHYHQDPDGLRKRLIEEIKQFEIDAHKRGVEPEDLYRARYALCTALDDVVLNTKWGSRSSWNQESLTYLFYDRDQEGGKRFFKVLDDLLRNWQSRRSRNILEIMYICLCFGFQGRYRHETNRTEELKKWRERVFRAIRPDHVMELSPKWQGMNKPCEIPHRYLEWWVTGSAVLLLLVALYSFLSLKLNPLSEPVVSYLGNIRDGVVPGTVEEKIDRPVSAPHDRSTLSHLLKEEISRNEIELVETHTRSTIVISSSKSGEGLFLSGSAEVQPKHRGLVERIGDALKEQKEQTGKILVIGHTDSIPPRHGFTSNYDLSLFRAKAVQRILARQIGKPQRFLAAEGRGAEEPIANNVTAAGRARNRRVEITIFHYSTD
jgi:type VI secretion system protein ImpK